MLFNINGYFYKNSDKTERVEWRMEYRLKNMQIYLVGQSCYMLCAIQGLSFAGVHNTAPTSKEEKRKSIEI